ncbi:MAG TPA: hypothetical protein VIG32_02285 [Candidatus Baltobacteraceae bacterium]
MTTSSGQLPAATAAFSALIDYAGLFPPAKLAMTEALREYAEARRAPHAWTIGRFIVPASRMGELLAALDQTQPGEAALPASVIVDAEPEPRAWLASARAALAGIAALRRDGRIAIEALEVPLPPLVTRRETYDAPVGQFAMLLEGAALRDLPVYLEIPRNERFAELLSGALFAFARHRLRAKVRCGGITADAVPAPAELAAFVHAAHAERVAFKATAGLHHPVRHSNDASGFVMHGFLNLLGAAVFARDGADTADLTAILEEDDPAAFGIDGAGLRVDGRSAALSQIELARRESFVSYGSCSLSEPIGDLIALGMLEG